MSAGAPGAGGPPGAGRPVADAGPLGWLPRLSGLQVRLEERLSRAFPGPGLPPPFAWLGEWVGAGALSHRIEVLWRASGLRRSGLVAQFSWPRLATRLALGVEGPLAHAVVDRLLGFARLGAESRLQVTPVEWGIWTFVLARALERLATTPGPLGAWDLVLERVGPDPFDAAGLGEVITLRWTAVVGPVSGSVRLWLPGTLVARWLASDPPPPPSLTSADRRRFGDLSSHWRAEAGAVVLPHGLARLRAGGVLPLTDSPLRGAPRDPRGPVALTLSASGRGGRYRVPAEPVPASGGGRLTITGPLTHEPTPREPRAVDPAPEPAPAAPADVPVTLVVELGRVNLALQRLADLKPGDVIALARHSREPIELTSGGRLVARGELVQIDTELGVRVTQVFL